MKKSKGNVKKGALGAGLGAVAGAPLGPVGMVGGAALGSKLGGGGDEKKSADKPVRKKKPVQKLLPALAAGAVGGKLLGLSDNKKKPVQKILGSLVSDIMASKSGDKPVQKLLPALAAGAIGGKLLGLSDDKPIQKLLPALAAGAIGGKLLGLSKKKGLPVQKIIGGLVSSLGQAAGGAVGSLGLQEEDEEEIEKHRGKSFHSHKRKNPFLNRRK